MDTSKQTYKRINTFINVANIVLSQDIDGNKLPKDSKLAYALRRVLPKCREAIEEYNTILEDINVEFASEDPEGNLARQGNEYKYTKANQQKRLTKIREKFRSETEVPQYFATDVPEWLPEDVKESFFGFVIKEEENDL